MELFDPQAVAEAYDRVAPAYHKAFGDELDHVPQGRALLERAAECVAPGELGLEVGAGPGQAVRHLTARGVPMLALDLSLEMLRTMRRHNPSSPALQADLRLVPARTASVALVVARYVLQHLAPHELGPSLTELRRVLRPGGALVVSTHLGDDVVAVDELLGTAIPAIGGTFHDRAELVASCEACGLAVRESFQRGPLPGEFPSERLYLRAEAVDPRIAPSPAA